MGLVSKAARILALLVLTMLCASAADAGVATLYKGNTALGQIPVMDGSGGYVLSMADAGALLGLEASVVGEELLLSRNKDKLRVVLNAVAAWHNNQLIPLYSATYVKDDRWWLDVPSSLSLLQRVAGKGASNRLRIEEAADGQAAQPAVAVAPAEPPSGEKTQASQQGKASAVTVVTIPKETVPAASGKASGKRGEAREVRWSTSREKVRAVIDCTEGAEPEMKVVSGKVALTFDTVSDALKGVPSPYENVAVEVVRGKDGQQFLFASPGARVEKLVLDDPRRIVLDFVFVSAAAIKEVQQPVETPATASSSTGSSAPRKNGKRLVVLDPGHGGKDPGAVGNGIKEKDINLAVGLKMEKALQAKGFNVRMTRKTDVYLKLQERTDIANKANADMFVSIHVNSLPPGKNASGFEIYLMALPTDKDALALAKFENQEYLEEKSGGNGAAADKKTEMLLKILGDMGANQKVTESEAAAEVLFKSGNTAGLPMRRVAQAPFFVLRGAMMPAVLLEMGFITNAREVKLLAHPGYQQKIADSMAAGISNYLK